jgi:hypothetical protein
MVVQSNQSSISGLYGREEEWLGGQVANDRKKGGKPSIAVLQDKF